MYKYTLNIYIISHSDFIEKAISDVKPSRGFTHSIESCTQLPQALEDESIVIIDDDMDMLKQVSKVKGRSCIVVYCADRFIPSDCYDVLWKKPLEEQEVRLYFAYIIDRIKLEKDNLLQKNYVNTLIDNNPDLIWFKDLKGAHLKVNDSFCHAVSKTKQQIEGRGHYYIWDIDPDEYSKGEYVCLESEEMVISAKKTMIFDEQVKTKNGMRQFLTVKSPVFDEYNNIMGTVGQARDVTDINNISRELDLFINNMPFGVIVSDADDVITNINICMERLIGYDLRPEIGEKSKLNMAEIIEVIEDIPGKKVFNIEFSVIENKKIIEVTKLHLTDVFKNHIGYLRIFRDITNEKKLEEQVIHNANTDFLTGLYNRRYFYNYINSNCMGKAVGIMSLDLDNFKSVNDTYGHQVGDDVLIMTARYMNECFNTELTVRNGGDEFIVVFESADRDTIESKVKMMLNSLNTAFADNEKYANVRISASAGIAVTDCLDCSVDELLKKSDMALYSVKRGNKGGYCIV